jgi:hypothetical protein
MQPRVAYNTRWLKRGLEAVKVGDSGLAFVGDWSKPRMAIKRPRMAKKKAEGGKKKAEGGVEKPRMAKMDC